eukprot:1649363-Rhodomonas_salina.2
MILIFLTLEAEVRDSVADQRADACHQSCSTNRLVGTGHRRTRARPVPKLTGSDIRFQRREILLQLLSLSLPPCLLHLSRSAAEPVGSRRPELACANVLMCVAPTVGPTPRAEAAVAASLPALESTAPVEVVERSPATELCQLRGKHVGACPGFEPLSRMEAGCRLTVRAPAARALELEDVVLNMLSRRLHRPPTCQCPDLSCHTGSLPLSFESGSGVRDLN